jgi:hypothetical protein
MATQSAVELEGLYRWFGNEAFGALDILRPHVELTRQRAATGGTVRVVYDTTDFAFKGDREELGVIEGGVQGFFAHVALAVGPDDQREPLGVLGLHTYVNQDPISRRGLTRAQQRKLFRQTPRESKTSHRWEGLALNVARELPDGLEAIHIMDQEADDFVVLATLRDNHVRFVVRGSQTRRLAAKGPTIEDALSKEPQTLFRDVHLEHRQKTKAGARYRARDSRPAELSIRWTQQLTMTRPEDAQCSTKSTTLYAVQVFEANPPEGVQSVDWTLLTSEPIHSLDDAARVVDHYRARWLIEEFFKALKTGCAVEQRQLTTRGGLEKAVAVFMPIAWEMLRLRHLSRVEPETPALTIVSAEDLVIVRAILGETKRDFVLPPQPTVRDLLLGIARLGGHLKRNGDPGWITLGRGMDQLVRARSIWALAKRCDQS